VPEKALFLIFGTYKLRRLDLPVLRLSLTGKCQGADWAREPATSGLWVCHPPLTSSQPAADSAWPGGFRSFRARR